MPDFTPGRWWIAPPMFDGEVIYAPPTVEGRRNDVVAMGILNKADAKLIATAPVMYKLLKDFVNPEIRSESIAYQVLQEVTAALLNDLDRKENYHDKADLDS